jgi:predicted NBD/HSP70 family sugar kinase
LAAERASSIEVKKINRNNIYKYLYRHDPMSIQELTAALNLSLPTVTQNLKELQESKLISEAGLFESTGGRKAKAIVYNSTARYSVGVDITRNHAGIVLIDLYGNVVRHIRKQYPFDNSKEYFEGLGRILSSFIEESGVSSDKILGVGIALPAIISEDRQSVSYATVIDFTGGNVKSFAEFIPYPCVFTNDANAAGFAELWGSFSEENVVYLSLNNSVGGSILIGRNIYQGQNQRSAEFGHMTIVPDGRTCYCGQKGCVDAYCSARILSDSTNGNIEEFFRLLRMNREPQKTIWEEYLPHLVITINNLRMLYDCNVIVGGCAGAYMDEYIGRLREMVSRRNTFEADGTYLHVCRYKLEATAVGAALMLVRDFIDSV